jgi:hypothetical protein
MCSKLRKELVYQLTKTKIERLFPMETITEIPQKAQHLLTQRANELAKKQDLSGVNGN